MGISARTVAHHIEHVLGKLDAGSRTSAAGRAVEETHACPLSRTRAAPAQASDSFRL